MLMDIRCIHMVLGLKNGIGNGLLSVLSVYKISDIQDIGVPAICQINCKVVDIFNTKSLCVKECLSNLLFFAKLAEQFG